jgi:hypothetical protein
MLFCTLTGGNFMPIKWDAIFENEKKQFEKMTEQDKFISCCFNSDRLTAGGKKTRKAPIVPGRCVWRYTPLQGCWFGLPLMTFTGGCLPK